MLLSFYGIAVCPYIDSLPPYVVVLIFIAAFSLHGLMSVVVSVKLIDSSPVDERAFKQFWFELGLYIATGLILGLFNFLIFDFPLESGLKVVVGTLSIGLFASIDNALHRERCMFSERKTTSYADQDTRKIFSVSRKLAFLFSLIMIITAMILMLVLYKDTNYLISEYASSPEHVQRAFFMDVLFVMGIIMLFGLRVLYSYSKNLKLLFDNQVDTMTRVGEGDLDIQVPLMTRDEFRLIAQKTNQMIGGLREKERLRRIFGKVVSPTVAEQLLKTETERLRDGLNLQVAVLFCDIRSFTTLSESISPEEVVLFLNDYFSRMLEVIEQHHGVVDKFIGDAILAVFGLERLSDKDHGNSIEQAVQAALAMQVAAENSTLPDGEALGIGIGLHAGQVIAGTIGSPDRFEFTVIGDTVNTASRLEGLCKRLEQPIVLSAMVYDALSDELKSYFIDQGKVAIRGREREVHVYTRPNHI
jgi:adenylate cyclase